MVVLLWSTGALAAGFALDLIFGDPRSFPHMVRLMGQLIAALEKRLRKTLPATAEGELFGGAVLVTCLTLACLSIPLGVLLLCYRLFAPLGFVIESLLCWQVLAAKSLKSESMGVRSALERGDIEAARREVSMIVGRDTASLDGPGIIRAAVETVAENTSDGVTAPMLFTMLGGAPAGCLYKAVSTMDSMVGYKNDEHINFGRAAARLDDIFNHIPSRLSALFMIAAAFLLRLDYKGAFHIWRRDRRNHASPNSAQTEAVCAGALGIRLAGPAAYSGKTQYKPYIGDDTRPVAASDIEAANKLMYATAGITLIFAILFRLGVLILGTL